MTGIIDIGSNTIRLVMYDRGKQLSNTGINSEIIADTKNGELTGEGIKKLCSQLEYLKSLAGESRVCAFATYAVRILKNSAAVRAAVLEKTGLDIDILSGEREAWYDFLGLKSTLPKGAGGIGMDLGGGSGQVMIFSGSELKFSSSYPIGCRRIKNKLVKGKIPTAAEEAAVKRYLNEKLSEVVEMGASAETLYMMGGTAKIAAKLYTYLKGRENTDIIKTAEIDDLVRFIAETPPEVMQNVLKSRYDSIVVGIVIIRELAKMFGAENIHIKKCGVRDGYLFGDVKNAQTASLSTN